MRVCRPMYMYVSMTVSGWLEKLCHRCLVQRNCIAGRRCGVVQLDKINLQTVESKRIRVHKAARIYHGRSTAVVCGSDVR